MMSQDNAKATSATEATTSLNDLTVVAARAPWLAANCLDTLDRLRQDSMFASVDVMKLLDPARYVGRAPQQVSEFLRSVIGPLERRYKSVPTLESDLSV